MLRKPVNKGACYISEPETPGLTTLFEAKCSGSSAGGLLVHIILPGGSKTPRPMTPRLLCNVFFCTPKLPLFTISANHAHNFVSWRRLHFIHNHPPIRTIYHTAYETHHTHVVSTKQIARDWLRSRPMAILMYRKNPHAITRRISWPTRARIKIKYIPNGNLRLPPPVYCPSVYRPVMCTTCSMRSSRLETPTDQMAHTCLLLIGVVVSHTPGHTGPTACTARTAKESRTGVHVTRTGVHVTCGVNTPILRQVASLNLEKICRPFLFKIWCWHKVLHWKEVASPILFFYHTLWILNWEKNSYSAVYEFASETRFEIGADLEGSWVEGVLEQPHTSWLCWECKLATNLYGHSPVLVANIMLQEKSTFQLMWRKNS